MKSPRLSGISIILCWLVLLSAARPQDPQQAKPLWHTAKDDQAKEIESARGQDEV